MTNVPLRLILSHSFTGEAIEFRMEGYLVVHVMGGEGEGGTGEATTQEATFSACSK